METSPTSSETLRSAAIAAHLKEPLSELSLSISPKDFISLGSYYGTSIPHTTVVGQEPEIKSRGSLELRANIDESSELYYPHTVMMDAFARILGKDVFAACAVYFTHKVGSLRPDAAQGDWNPHLDGSRHAPVLKLIGLFHNVLATKIIHDPIDPLNPLKPTDDSSMHTLYSRGKLLSRGMLRSDAGLNIQELPNNQLNIVSPSTPHYAQTTTEYIPRREFMRWHVQAAPKSIY